MVGVADEPGAEKRHHSQRDDIGGEEREHHRERKRYKEEAADAVKEDDWEKDDGCCEGGGEYGQRHLAAAALGRNLGARAHLQMAKDVLEHDDGVVDQPGEGEREAAQHHGIDGLA